MARAKMTLRPLTLLYLNVAGGQWFEQLTEYISQVAEHVDVFCFQEVIDTPTEIKFCGEARGRIHHIRTDLFRQLQLILPEHQGFFAWSTRLATVDFPLYFGNAMFIRRNRVLLDVPSVGDFMVYRKRDSMRGEDVSTLPRNIQYAVLELRGGKRLTVFNFHGLWQPGGKGDTPTRLRQFQAVRAVVEQYSDPKILGGDFNTFPTSKASRVLEESGMRNLVSEHGIERTRNLLYERPHNGLHADNVFVSGVPIVELEVPEVLASDHLPLVLRVRI